LFVVVVVVVVVVVHLIQKKMIVDFDSYRHFQRLLMIYVEALELQILLFHHHYYHFELYL